MNKIHKAYVESISISNINEVVSGSNITFNSPSTFLDDAYQFDSDLHNGAFSSLMGCVYNTKNKTLNILLGGPNTNNNDINKFIKGDQKMWKPILDALKQDFVDYGSPKIKHISGNNSENITHEQEWFKFKLTNGPSKSVIEEIYLIVKDLYSIYDLEDANSKKLTSILKSHI